MKLQSFIHQSVSNLLTRSGKEVKGKCQGLQNIALESVPEANTGQRGRLNENLRSRRRAAGARLLGAGD